ncbi:hypothetical protein K0A97_00915 [Patescibacteria group bacterium]|nr:hypothetical protein [Patescibacteria group bacterium]
MKTKLIIKKNKIVSPTIGKCNDYTKEAISKIEKFFNKKIDFKIIFLKSRDEINKTYSNFFGKDYQTENWVVGGFFGKDTVYILNEDSFDSESCHPKKEFFPTLVHEITHIFIKKIFGFQYPFWLNEGIASVVADQDNINLDKKDNLQNAYTQEDWIKKNPYLTAGKFTRFLINEYSKEKVFELMKKLDIQEKKDSFKEKFKKIFENDFDTIWECWFKK